MEYCQLEEPSDNIDVVLDHMARRIGAMLKGETVGASYGTATALDSALTIP